MSLRTDHIYKIDALYEQRIKTTDDLKELLLSNIKLPINYRNRFLAQVFQALRIEVNDELINLEIFLTKILSKLKCNSRISILSYHSLEDRIVKNFFKNNKNILSSLFEKPLTASKDEILSNSRSRSAKLRVLLSKKVTKIPSQTAKRLNT